MSRCNSFALSGTAFFAAFFATLRAIVLFLPAGLPASSARSRQVSIRVSVLAAVRHHRSMENITRCGMIVKRNLPRRGKFLIKSLF
jgi:hypothetical protein